MSSIVAYNFNRSYLAKYGACELALGAFGFGVMPLLPIPPAVCALSGCVAAGAGLRHLVQFWETRQEKKRLNDSNFFNVDHSQVAGMREEALRDASAKKPKQLPPGALEDYYYLGKGFTWTPKHMALYEQIKNDHSFQATSDLSNVAGGRPFIHNLGRKDVVPQVLSLKEHTLIAGESGSGKTVLLNLLTSQFIRDGEAVCVIDPKGDRNLLNSIYSLCKEAGRVDDFLFFSLSHPGKSVKFDPMANSLRSNDAANRITSIIENGSGDDAFTKFVWNVLNTVAENLINANIPVSLKNLHKYALLEMDELYMGLTTELDGIRDMTQRAALATSLKRLQVIVEHPREHFSKMITSLQPVLTALATGETGELLSAPEDGVTWKQVIKGKKIIYFNLASMIDNYTSSAVSKLLVQDLISYIGQVYAYDRSMSRIKLICDEFYSVAYRGFGDALNKSRAAGLQAILGLQTDSDIAAQLDRDMVDVMLGNLPNKIYLRIGQQHLAERFTKLFPEANYVEIQRSRSVNAAPTDDDLLYRSGSGQRTQSRVQTIVTPEMVMGLPQGQAFVYNKGMPFQVAIPMLNQSVKVNYFEQVLNTEYRYGRKPAAINRMRAKKKAA